MLVRDEIWNLFLLLLLTSFGTGTNYCCITEHFKTKWLKSMPFIIAHKYKDPAGSLSGLSGVDACNSCQPWVYGSADLAWATWDNGGWVGLGLAQLISAWSLIFWPPGLGLTLRARKSSKRAGKYTWLLEARA